MSDESLTPSPQTPRPMTQRQTDVLDRLQRVLAACHVAGIAICGMDDKLAAYRADDFDRLAETLPSAYEVQQELIAAGTDRQIDDHGAYRESGGW